MPRRKKKDTDVLGSMVRRIKPVTKSGGSKKTTPKSKATPKGKRFSLEDKPMRFTGKGLTEAQRKKMLALMRKGGSSKSSRYYKI